MKDFIFNEIKSKACCEACSPKWKEFQISLPKLLDGFDPRVSNDGVKISYQEKKGRYSLSIMRFLTRKLGLLDLLVENNVNKIADSIAQGYYSDEFKVRLDTGVTITENYKNSVGGGSCMCGDYSKYTRLYEMNPDRFEHLVVTCKNNSARAIIAKLDNGEKFAGRAYCDNSACTSKLEAYARKQGWYDVSSEDMIVSDLKWVEGGFPYQDDLGAYYVQRDGNITIGTHTAFKEAGISWHGDTDVQYGYLEDEPTRCYNCRTHIESGDEFYIGGEDYCETCVDDLYTVCSSCSEYIYNDHVVTVEGEDYCETCSQDVGSFCEHCETLVLSENIEVVEDGDEDTVGASSRRTIEVCNECYSNVSFILIREKYCQKIK